jgi:hypothetical protein
MHIDKQIEELPLTLTVGDISRILNIGKNNAYDLCNSIDFPAVKVGKRIIIPKLAFIEWMLNPKKQNGA